MDAVYSINKPVSLSMQKFERRYKETSRNAESHIPLDQLNREKQVYTSIVFLKKLKNT